MKYLEFLHLTYEKLNRTIYRSRTISSFFCWFIFLNVFLSYLKYFSSNCVISAMRRCKFSIEFCNCFWICVHCPFIRSSKRVVSSSSNYSLTFHKRVVLRALGFPWNHDRYVIFIRFSMKYWFWYRNEREKNRSVKHILKSAPRPNHLLNS